MICKDFDCFLNAGKPIREWYVYAWANADWGGVYFYVGKGHGKRYCNVEQRGKAFQAILDKWSCFPTILEDGLTEEEAEEQEVYWKQFLIFDKGFPIMDGEGHSESLKHLATLRGKQKKRLSDPTWREGRKALEIPDEFYEKKNEVAEGSITVVDACKELGISRSTWYKWVKGA